MTKLLHKLSDFYLTLDLRSLGLFRIILAIFLIYDWFMRWPNLEAFYTSFGFLPPGVGSEIGFLIMGNGTSFHFSIFDEITYLNGVQGIFLIGLLFYVLFLIGYKTRWLTFLCFIFLENVENRNNLISDGADHVLISMLVWSIFLPLGERFSIDSLLKDNHSTASSTPGKRKKEKNICPPSLAAFAIVLQIATIYFVTSFTKIGETWKDGTAVYYALKLDQFSRPLGLCLANWLSPASSKFLTWAALGIEYSITPLLLMPFGQPIVRRIAILMMVLFHLGIMSTMAIGDFQIIMIGICSILISEADWNWIEKKIRFLNRYTFIEKIQSFLKVVWVKASKPLNDPGIKKKKTQTINPPFLSIAGNVLVALTLATGLIESYYLNIAPIVEGKNAAKINGDNKPFPLKAIIEVPHLKQNWAMFAPNAPRNHSWWVIDGETVSGSHMDPLTGTTPFFEEPSNLQIRYDKFWLKYLYNLAKKRYSIYRPYFAQYLIRKNWRDTPNPKARFVRLDFYYLLEKTPPPGDKTFMPHKQISLLKYDCSKKRKNEESDDSSFDISLED